MGIQTEYNRKNTGFGNTIGISNLALLLTLPKVIWLVFNLSEYLFFSFVKLNTYLAELLWGLDLL